MTMTRRCSMHVRNEEVVGWKMHIYTRNIDTLKKKCKVDCSNKEHKEDCNQIPGCSLVKKGKKWKCKTAVASGTCGKKVKFTCSNGMTNKKCKKLKKKKKKKCEKLGCVHSNDNCIGRWH